jgi:hypothetical protein
MVRGVGVRGGSVWRMISDGDTGLGEVFFGKSHLIYIVFLIQYRGWNLKKLLRNKFRFTCD